MSIRVVIVDDAPFIREVVRGSLTSGEFVVIGEATDGAEAVKMVTELKPDVVLMDIVMPYKTGIEATTEILENLPEMKIVACSTVDEEKMVQKALDAGCVNFLAKPFEKEELLKILREAVAGRGV